MIVQHPEPSSVHFPVSVNGVDVGAVVGVGVGVSDCGGHGAGVDNGADVGVGIGTAVGDGTVIVSCTVSHNLSTEL